MYRILYIVLDLYIVCRLEKNVHTEREKYEKVHNESNRGKCETKTGYLTSTPRIYHVRACVRRSEGIRMRGREEQACMRSERH